MNILQKDHQPAVRKQVAPKYLIGVRIHDGGKSRLCDPGSLKLRVGMRVVVEWEKTSKVGVVASNKIFNYLNKPSNTISKVLRIANENDLQALDRKKALERKAKALCIEKIEELKLPMNLSRVVHIPEGNKTIFFFTAEGRVDFRQLIRDLASNLHHRIEMKQVGVRDEARAIGGNGMCGESLCCSTFLNEFTPVTIRTAKDQGLALNPTKISGVCGRLMCCLQYEHESYKNLIKNLPKPGSQVQTPEGPGKVLKNEILEQKIVVHLNDESITTFPLKELKGYPPKKSPAKNS